MTAAPACASETPPPSQVAYDAGAIASGFRLKRGSFLDPDFTAMKPSTVITTTTTNTHNKQQQQHRDEAEHGDDVLPT